MCRFDVNMGGLLFAWHGVQGIRRLEEYWIEGGRCIDTKILDYCTPVS
jgi:hypothetical protein